MSVTSQTWIDFSYSSVKWGESPWSLHTKDKVFLELVTEDQSAPYKFRLKHWGNLKKKRQPKFGLSGMETGAWASWGQSGALEYR